MGNQDEQQQTAEWKSKHNHTEKWASNFRYFCEKYCSFLPMCRFCHFSSFAAIFSLSLSSLRVLLLMLLLLLFRNFSATVGLNFWAVGLFPFLHPLAFDAQIYFYRNWNIFFYCIYCVPFDKLPKYVYYIHMYISFSYIHINRGEKKHSPL